ncbi:MAG: PmeII family type II restriction endonuclease [bacterium]|nr:PmeII family type II restriction endonuclease [bacterium]
MKAEYLTEIRNFLYERLIEFHYQKSRLLDNITLDRLLRRRTPYFLKAKNIHVASDFAQDVLESYLSEQEELLFNRLLVDLAVYTIRICQGGGSSVFDGIDLEFVKEKTHYLVAIRPEIHWGGDLQRRQLVNQLETAWNTLIGKDSNLDIQPVLGICYGKADIAMKGRFMRIVGRDFWSFLSDEANFYNMIIDPLMGQAAERDDIFLAGRARAINLLAQQLMDDFSENGIIQWRKLVELPDSENPPSG